MTARATSPEGRERAREARRAALAELDRLEGELVQRSLAVVERTRMVDDAERDLRDAESRLRDEKKKRDEIALRLANLKAAARSRP